jgi:hypothetical protein
MAKEGILGAAVQTIPLKNWEDFESAMAKLLETIDTLRTEKYPIVVSTPLFRGHTDSSWKLESTLDRFTKREISVENYYKTIRAVRPAVVSITQKVWPLPDFEDTRRPPRPPIGYEFMIYLRHHGFPSPLLDWTQSPYVAAFFAFRSNKDIHADSVAIYSYVDFMEGGRAHYEGEPVIFALGPYAVTHKRHYSQQCEYTTCTRGGPDGTVYCSHEVGIPKNDEEGRLIKYTIPWTERKKVMQKLELMNITAFSLFGSEESLMETLAYKELEARLLERLSRFENFRCQASAEQP